MVSQAESCSGGRRTSPAPLGVSRATQGCVSFDMLTLRLPSHLIYSPRSVWKLQTCQNPVAHNDARCIVCRVKSKTVTIVVALCVVDHCVCLHDSSTAQHESREALRSEIDTQLERAARLREKYVQEIARKAGIESEKVAEIAFIKRMEGSNGKQSLEQRLSDAARRRNQYLETIRAKQQKMTKSPTSKDSAAIHDDSTNSTASSPASR